ncbi:MAG: glucoamylase family protein, partial [Opitutaceae bacterium]
FFETLTGPADHWLPPDNLQEDPAEKLATRTSPTNIGLAMLGTLGAHDFGYLSLEQMARRLEATLDTLDQLERHHGHFYNWYDTRTLRVMPPLYLSTVDNGNLAGLLLTLQAGLLELIDTPWNAARVFAGLRDTWAAWSDHVDLNHGSGVPDIFDRELARAPATPEAAASALSTLITAAEKLTARTEDPHPREFARWREAFLTGARGHEAEMRLRFPEVFPQDAAEPVDPKGETAADAWTSRTLRKLAADAGASSGDVESNGNGNGGAPVRVATARPVTAGRRAESAVRAWELMHQLTTLAGRCEEFARMDFSLLYDRSRDLFSIGYNVTQHRLDASCYDLLASEARLGSFVAIALGQVPQKHWFMLGRRLTTTRGEPALISWSGSMFEYLMPPLVMPAHENTLLHTSTRVAVARQIEYGRQMEVPWGISESGYNLRDADANYQYRAFGVPGLGFKRGLADDLVIAPYATVMALMVEPEKAWENLARLRRERAAGRFGFYEAADYTVARVPNGGTHAIVRSFMAHHQGMSLLSLAHVLLDRPMQRRFSANPLFKAAELLLHERVPRETNVLYPHELEAASTREHAPPAGTMFRVFTDPDAGPPQVHLLSNGRYHVMITNAGGGYSRWNDIALTRWRADATRDHWGTFVYLRDHDSGRFWSAAHQPTLQPVQNYEAIFSQGRAEFRGLCQDIETHTEISVSPEDDVEVRRITLGNRANQTRTIELTTFAEVVLNSAAADLAHPAFSNLFVQTEFLASHHAVICSRRPRAPGDAPPWMFHLLLASGPEAAPASCETDRAHFLGRMRSAVSPGALQGPPRDLANTAGSVLDPAVALRRVVRLETRARATLTLVSGVAATREALLELIEKYQDQNFADRSFELAWTQGLLMLRHLGATEPDAQLYGRLAGAILYPQSERRAHPSVIVRNRHGQRHLWSFGISGDLPIVLVHARADHMELLGQVVRAHAYWRLKGLAADLVVLAERDSIYRQSL